MERRRLGWLYSLMCFFVGYNKTLLSHCSEQSRNQVKKYFAALVILMILWGFIGYNLGRVYFKLSWLYASIVAAVLVFMVVMVERQIILSSKNGWIAFTRGLLAVAMAVLGAVITDQIIFQDDLEKMKITAVQEEVERLLPYRTMQLQQQIAEMDSIISAKESEKNKLTSDVERRPRIYNYDVEVERDSANNVVRKIINRQSIPNPKIEMLKDLNAQIKSLREEKRQKETQLLDMRQQLEEELKSKKGFIDEINLMIKLIWGSWGGGIAWGSFFLIFLAMELLIVVTKYFESESDYDKMIQYSAQVNKLHFQFPPPEVPQLDSGQ